MKSLYKWLSAIAFLLQSSSLFFAQLPSYLPLNGLVAWYPFNGNANDESGNGNNGVVNGNCFLVGDRFGNSNAAYFFDGYGDFIDAPDIMQDNFSVLITMRVANFMCCYNGQVGASIFSNFTNDLGFPGPNGVEIGFSTSNELGVGNGLSGVSFNSIIQASTWYQLGLTKQGNNIKLYIDGVLVQESNDWISSSIGSTITRFGGRGNINPLFLEFNGILDDIAVYNRALSSTEVTGFYEGTPTNPNGGNSGSGAGSSNSPAPPGIPYQAEVRNESGEVLANANVNVRFTLHELSANGTVSYQETHTGTTNELGLFAATIGGGTATQGTFAGINWAQTTKFLQVEVDTGNGYITMGNQQLMSVPYALHSTTADMVTGVINEIDPQFAASPSSGISSNDITNWQNKLDSESQILSISNDTIYLSGGSFIKIPESFSGDYNDLTNKPFIPSSTSELTNTSGFITAIEGGIPVGAVFSYAGHTIPQGWLICDGSSVDRYVYSNLFNAIGTSWGEGNGATTFNLPDLRGQFLRGVDGTAGIDPDKSSRSAKYSGGNTGNNVGSYQNDELKSHSHNYNRISGTPTQTFFPWSFGGSPQLAPNPVNDAIYPAGGSESRPKNAYVLYMIKY